MKIRQNVFETNSSSSHSITMVPSLASNLYDTILPDDDGKIVLEGGEFGWAWVTFNDPLTKANYCAVDVAENQVRLDKLFKVIKDHTGAKEVVFLNKGYIDHQSVGTSSEAFESDETLKNFIFNRECTLQTGNDNSDPPGGFSYFDEESKEYEDQY